MRNLLQQLEQALAGGQSVAYCRLVETRGSTPQKAGALMLVFRNGAQAGTLGGGCVEAEVKRKALAALELGKSEIAVFQLDSDYGWDDGLICGGRMHILIEPLSAGLMPAYFAKLAEFALADASATEAIVFDSAASQLSAPASYLLDAHGNFLASWPATAPRSPALLAPLKPLERRPLPYVAHGISYLPMLARCKLAIVGGGHVGKAVADLAVQLDFEVIVIDDRAEYVSEARFPRAEQRLAGPLNQVLPQLEITANTFCLIVTRGHNNDQEALFHLANRGAPYVGLIGSRRKIKMIFENLEAAGVPPAVLGAVHAPVGLDIGSQTVPEIAVSICAQLVAERSGKRQ